MKLYDEEFYKERVNVFPFIRLMGMKLLSSAGGKSVMECRVRGELKNTGGVLHGGVVGALVDTSIATALRSVMPLSSKMTTVEYKVNFLKPIPEGTVTAYGNILRLGKTIAVGATEIRNGAGEVVAFGSATYYILSARSAAQAPAIMEKKTTRGGETAMTREGPIRPEMLVGEILREFPAVRGKVRELFGAECLQCRSNQRETIVYTSWHKGLDPAEVCRELNAALNPE